MTQGQLVALNYFGDYHVDGRTPETLASCEFMLVTETPHASASKVHGWRLLAREHRPSDNTEITAIYHRNSENIAAKINR